MLRVTLTGVITHRLRYALTALAVLLGVAFIAGTFVLTDTINSTFNGLYGQIYQGTGAVVRATEPFSPGTSFASQRRRIDASLATTLVKVPGVKAVALDIEGYAQLVARDGKPIGTASNGPPTLGVAWTDVAALSPLRMLPGGQPPRTSSQVVIDKYSADVGHFTVGDKVVVLTQKRPATYTITGIVTWGGADSPLDATITGFDPVTAARVLGRPGKVSQIDVEAAPGVSQSQLVVLSAISPARRAARIPPVAAMQHVAAESRQPSVGRALRGAILAAGGAAVLGIGLFGHAGNRITLVGGGAVAVFVGIAMLGPFIARPVSQLLGTPLAMRGPAGQLGQQNAMRNPSRTAATAAALMVGVALVSLTTIVASSARASVNTIISSAVQADYVVSSGGMTGGASGFSPELERLLDALPQVSATAGIRSGVVKAYGRVTPVVATDPVKADPLFNIGVTQGRLASMTSSGIAASTQVATSHQLRLGSPVTLAFPSTGSKTYTVQVIYSVRELAGDYILPLAAAQANFPQALDIDVFVKLAPGVSASAGRHAIEKVLSAYPNATLMDQIQYRAQQSRQVNQLLNLVYGLLGLAVIIALIGIANTLALSIHERTRELGLLRAVGTTRGQLRSIVRAEAFVISLFGAIEGLVLGMLFGWAVVTALHSQGITHLAFPVPQLLLVATLAGVAGIAAAIAPSRRAARLDILQAVTPS
jgi:ABC-type lipoprotein release transport system permease subunit